MTADERGPAPGLRQGDRIRSRGRTITESDLVSFAALTGDWHPQHADAEFAASSRFGERIAHGMLVLSYSVGLVDFDPESVVALRGLDALSFKRPVRVGETIRVEAEVLETEPVDAEHELATLRWRVLGAGGKAALRARVRLLVRSGAERDPADEHDQHDEPVVPAPGLVEAALYGSRVLLL